MMGVTDMPRTCRGCGCTDARACDGGCAWVLLDVHTRSGICSQCADALEWDAVLLADIGYEEPSPNAFELIRELRE